jgi:hypothetical protein
MTIRLPRRRRKLRRWMLRLLALWCIWSWLAHPACGFSEVQNTGKATSSASSAQQTLAFGSNNTAGNLLIVIAVTTASATTTVTVVDSNVTYSQAGAYATEGSQRISVWYKANCAAGANTVGVTPSIASKVAFGIFEFSGAATSGPLDATITNQNTGSINLSTTNVAVNAANELVIAGFSGTGGNQLAGFTATGSITSNGYQNASGSAVGLATTYNVAQSSAVAATATITGPNPWAAIAASFKPAAGGARGFLLGGGMGPLLEG